ncbi:hypothetical protein [Actinokineospora sp.]|uniref:hypothetical protein n=1 Tax=Actinokineospora sp. TaxID=1872133 RepID=UPI003D6C4EF1
MVVFAARWTVKGRKPDGSDCTTIFDLTPNRRWLVVYPAAVDDYSMTLDLDAVRMFLSIVECRNAGAVPGVHPAHGKRLLSIAPYQGLVEPPWTDRPANAPPYLGPIALSVRLPGGREIHIVYRTDRYQALVDTLTEIVVCLEGSKTVVR